MVLFCDVVRGICGAKAVGVTEREAAVVHIQKKETVEIAPVFSIGYMRNCQDQDICTCCLFLGNLVPLLQGPHSLAKLLVSSFHWVEHSKAKPMLPWQLVMLLIPTLRA